MHHRSEEVFPRNMYINFSSFFRRHQLRSGRLQNRHTVGNLRATNGTEQQTDAIVMMEMMTVMTMVQATVTFLFLGLLFAFAKRMMWWWRCFFDSKLTISLPFSYRYWAHANEQTNSFSLPRSTKLAQTQIRTKFHCFFDIFFRFDHTLQGSSVQDGDGFQVV